MCELEPLDHHERVLSILRSIKADLVCHILDISEYSTKFHVMRFIRIFFYHIIFWYCGPLIVVPLVAIFDSYALSFNMGFNVSRESIGNLLIQLLQFSVTIFLVIMQLLKRYQEVEED